MILNPMNIAIVLALFLYTSSVSSGKPSRLEMVVQQTEIVDICIDSDTVTMDISFLNNSDKPQTLYNLKRVLYLPIANNLEEVEERLPSLSYCGFHVEVVDENDSLVWYKMIIHDTLKDIFPDPHPDSVLARDINFAKRYFEAGQELKKLAREGTQTIMPGESLQYKLEIDLTDYIFKSTNVHYLILYYVASNDGLDNLISDGVKVDWERAFTGILKSNPVRIIFYKNSKN